MSAAEIKDRMRLHAHRRGSQSAAAKEAGVSPQFFGDVLKGRREISDKIAKQYLFRRVVTFEPMSLVEVAVEVGRRFDLMDDTPRALRAKGKRR